jgi:hypothetical protein|tara:strand:- start:2172 stop:2393 length:222 start_codon:yes stop_codon:yes gene_type:complete
MNWIIKAWDKAYENTKTIVSYNKYSGFKSYTKGCKNCGTTNYKETTREMQKLGNCVQRIVICECSNYFIEEWQ